MGAKRAPRDERFWRYVVQHDDGCWEWSGCHAGNGYGHLRVNGKAEGAHRIAWEIANQRLAPVGMCVCHHCDNRGCVRPDHLFLGTAVDNAQDMVRKGRNRTGVRLRGAQVATHKLTEPQVRAIKQLNAAKASQVETGRRFGVSTTVINNIAHGKAWAWVL